MRRACSSSSIAPLPSGPSCSSEPLPSIPMKADSTCCSFSHRPDQWQREKASSQITPCGIWKDAASVRLPKWSTTIGVEDRGLGTPLLGLAPARLANVELVLTDHCSQARSSRSWEPVAQRADAAEHSQHHHAKPGHIHQETATLDKDRHDRVAWLRGHKREQNSGRTGKLLCPSHAHEGGTQTDGNRTHGGQRRAGPPDRCSLGSEPEGRRKGAGCLYRGRAGESSTRPGGAPHRLWLLESARDCRAQSQV